MLLTPGHHMVTSDQRWGDSCFELPVIQEHPSSSDLHANERPLPPLPAESSDPTDSEEEIYLSATPAKYPTRTDSLQNVKSLTGSIKSNSCFSPLNDERSTTASSVPDPVPQFHVYFSAHFSTCKITYERSIPSNTHHPCESLSRLKKSSLESALRNKIMDLIDRKRQDRLAFVACAPHTATGKEFRLCFSVNCGVDGDKHCFLGTQSMTLCVEDAREIIASLETIVAGQIEIVDPAYHAPARNATGQAMQSPEKRPEMLSLSFDICDADQSILLTHVVSSASTPTYPLPPADETRELMQRLFVRTSTVLAKGEPGKLSSTRRKIKGKVMCGFCVSFDCLFTDPDHKWFGGLCYSTRKYPFRAGELERLAEEIEEVFRAELEMFGRLGALGWTVHPIQRGAR